MMNNPIFNIKCINSQYEGTSLHGVRYERKNFRIHGLQATGVFPVFEGIKVELQEDVDTLYHRLGNTDSKFYNGTMQEATKVLKSLLRQRPALARQFTARQLDDINMEKKDIDGKTWHHYEELTPDGRPLMQLVDSARHAACKHTGGSYTWNPKHFRT